jgi:hypothetical protein
MSPFNLKRYNNLNNFQSYQSGGISMTEETKSSPEPEATQQPGSSPWDDVIKDFQSLGQSISNAVQSAVSDDKNKEALHELRTGLEKAANQVAQSIDEAAHSAQADQVKTGVKKAVDDVRGFSDKVYTDTKPALITALESLNSGIQKMIDRLQESPAAPAAEETPEEEADA